MLLFVWAFVILKSHNAFKEGITWLSMGEERWVEAIKDGRIVTVSEREAFDDDLFVLRERKTPEPEKLAVPRARRVSSEPMSKVGNRWHTYEPTYKKNNVSQELIDNFHWELSKARKVKNLSRLQLANILGVSEAHIKLVENGELPSDDFVLITKLQNYLGINLRKDGKSFDTPMSSMPREVKAGPSYMSKPDPEKISLADLQRMKEARDRAKKSAGTKSSGLVGSDIEVIE